MLYRWGEAVEHGHALGADDWRGPQLVGVAATESSELVEGQTVTICVIVSRITFSVSLPWARSKDIQECPRDSNRALVSD